MRKSFLRRLSAATVAAGMAVASPALATNGYIANGYGGASKGMAGAGVAVPSGVLGLAQNPAMGLKVGNQAGMCLTSFFPERTTTISAGGALTTGTHKSKNPFFLIPCGGANWKLGDRASLGVFMFGNGGMNTEYATNFFAPLAPPGVATSPLGVNLEQAFVSVNLSYKLNEQITVGAAPVFAIQRFSATGLQPFGGFSSAPGNVSNRGDDWSQGFGYNLGILIEASPELTFGMSYRSKIDMDKFSKYSGLFANGGDFDVPATATIGVAMAPKTMPQWTFTGEVQKIFYSDIPSISNGNIPPFPALGTAGGLGFGWKDMMVYRLAAIYRANPKLTLRGGVSYATKFIDDSSAVVNSLTPATPQWHLSVGASYKINDRWGITTSYTHALDASVTGMNPGLTGGAQPVKIQMKQDEFAFGVTYRW